MSENERIACERCDYASELLNKENIPHVIKKREIGHINLLFEDKVVMSFWARTGRFIYTVNPNNCKNAKQLDEDIDRGIKKCIKVYKKTFRKEVEE